MRISLTVTAGPHEGQVFQFEGHDTFIVGRSKRSHFRLPHKDKYFSRVHFMVEVNPPHCRLMDMGSTNGTFVNSERVRLADLKHGDEIRAGKTTLRVDVDSTEDVDEPVREVQVTQRRPETAPPVSLQRAEPEFELPPELPAAPEPEPVPVAAVEAPPVEYRSASSFPVTLPPPRVPEPPASAPVEEAPPAFVEPPPREPEPARPRAPEVPTRDWPIPEPPPVAPPPPRRPAPVQREPCLVCGNLFVVTNPPPVCPACDGQLRLQHQPIVGYRVLRKLGHGGMGVVQLAVREADNSLVALKTIQPSVAGSQTKVERFLREADILKDLRHPNIVTFREMGEANGQLYFAMDYVPGIDAAHLLKQNGGPMAVARAVGMGCQLLDALDFAHGKGFVHRDIKPANLMVTLKDGKEVVKLADFGLARVYQASELSGLTMMGDMGGTLAFMAPEQITHFREAKPPADLYAAAATLYNLLTDKFVHDLPKATEQRLLMILTEEVVPVTSRRAEIPDGLAAVLHRALAKDPEERFADAKSMRKMLTPFAR